MANDSQNFSNHSKFVPGYHYVTLLLAAIFVVLSVKRLIANAGADSVYFLIGALALVGTTWYARTFALQAQNRVIRLEERLRLARVLPADLQANADAITPSQLIGLRFASDGDVVELARKAIANPAMTAKEIKMQIKNWRADHYRL